MDIDIRFRKMIVLLGLSLIGFAIGQDLTAMSVVLPEIQQALTGGLTNTLWVYYAYLLAITVFLPWFNLYSKVWSPRRTILIGASCFVLGSFIAEFSINMPMLILGRAIQGIGTAAIIPAVMIWLEELYAHFDIKSRFFVLFTTLGLGIGPLIAASHMDVNAIHAIDHLSLEAALIGTLLTLCAIPRASAKSQPQLDIKGILALTGALLAFLVVLTSGATWGWTAWKSLLTLGVGLIATVYFILDELQAENPIYDIRKLTQIPVLIRALITFMMGWIIGTALIIVPIYAHGVLDYLPFIVALAMLPLTFGAFLTFHISRHVPAMQDSQFRLIVSYVGFIIFALMATQVSADTSLAYIALMLLPLGLAWGINIKIITDMNALHVRSAINQASSLLISMTTLGALLGTALSVAYYQINEKAHALIHINRSKIILPVDIKKESEGLVRMILDIGDMDKLGSHMPYHITHELIPMLKAADAYAFTQLAWLMFWVIIFTFGINLFIQKKYGENPH